jgi:hypothetical protein
LAAILLEKLMKRNASSNNTRKAEAAKIPFKLSVPSMITVSLAPKMEYILILQVSFNGIKKSFRLLKDLPRLSILRIGMSQIHILFRDLKKYITRDH